MTKVKKLQYAIVPYQSTFGNGSIGRRNTIKYRLDLPGMQYHGFRTKTAAYNAYKEIYRELNRK